MKRHDPLSKNIRTERSNKTNFSYDEADRMLEHLHCMLHDEATNAHDRAETMQLLQIYALLKLADKVNTVVDELRKIRKKDEPEWKDLPEL